MRNRTRAVAGVCGAWLVLGAAGGASAGPPASPEGTAPAGAPAEGAPAAAEGAAPGEGAAQGEGAALPATATVSVPKVQRDMESDMSLLGELASDAKRDADLVRAACVLDKQERAQGVMELATGELLVIRDDAAAPEARSFAVEKLQASSDRLDDLVQQARDCVGDQTPEMSDDETRNEVQQEPTIPIADPTVGGGVGGGKPTPPPPVDDNAPPTVGSPSM